MSGERKGWEISAEAAEHREQEVRLARQSEMAALEARLEAELPRGEHFILGPTGEHVEVNMITWARWFEHHPRHIRSTRLHKRGQYIKYQRTGPKITDYVKLKRTRLIWISTVFLGLNHRHGDAGPPILYETLVFGGPLDGEGERYCTRAEAVAGHRRWVHRARWPH